MKFVSGLLNLPKKVKIVEVGVRDGLQNEKSGIISADIKLKLLYLLQNAGLHSLEAGSFVSPKWVPQMSTTEDIFKAIKLQQSIVFTSEETSRYNVQPIIKYPWSANYTALTPNKQGIEKAIELDVKEVAVFTTISESFCQKNVNCSIADSFQRFDDIFKLARRENIRVRGYISCVLGCPYEGLNVSHEKTIELTNRLLELGCYEVSLGDTIGIGTPGSTRIMMENFTNNSNISVDKLAVHFHDTYGQALSNILIALQYGVTTIDSSISGLGGCPYAKGASGNISTEDVVYMLNGLNIETGVDLQKLYHAACFVDNHLGRVSGSKVTRAMTGKLMK